MENSLEEVRGIRNRKKQTEPICCPVCSITIRPTEIEQHYALEMDRLNKIQLNPKLKKVLNNGTNHHDPVPGCSSNGTSSNETSNCPWITFQKIRNNRHSRLKIKAKKRKADEPICPICNERPTEDINIHVEMCLRKIQNKSNCGASTSDDEDENIDVEGEFFEEYEWAGQRRIRASSLLEGGYSATGVGISMNNSTNNDDEDEDLNVDGDDTQIYGSPQYTERDIIPLVSDENHSDTYLRRLVTTGNDGDINMSNPTRLRDDFTTTNNEYLSHPDTLESRTINNNTSNDSTESSSAVLKSNLINSDKMDNNGYNSFNSSSSHIIESLKSKIREHENQMSNKVKCLICMDEFRKPAVSICCWHVHCEECWLRTLGARKLCPQCNMITTPLDLRRIYM